MRRLLALVCTGSCWKRRQRSGDDNHHFEDLPKDIFTHVPGDKTSGGFLFDSSIDHSHIDGGATPIWSTTNGNDFPGRGHPTTGSHSRRSPAGRSR